MRREGLEKKQAVAKVSADGQIVPTKGAGHEYYGAHREEYMIEIPVYNNYHPPERGKRGQWTTISEPTTLTLDEDILERANASYNVLESMRKVRDRDHKPLSQNEKWSYMLEAIQKFIRESENDLDGNGRIKLQYTQGSDSWYSVDKTILDGYVPGDLSTVPEGFRLHEQKARFPNTGQPYIETILKRPLGNFIPTPSELYNKVALISPAWDNSKDNMCVVRQMQWILCKRTQKYEAGRGRDKTQISDKKGFLCHNERPDKAWRDRGSGLLGATGCCAFKSRPPRSRNLGIQGA